MLKRQILAAIIIVRGAIFILEAEYSANIQIGVFRILEGPGITSVFRLDGYAPHIDHSLLLNLLRHILFFVRIDLDVRRRSVPLRRKNIKLRAAIGSCEDRTIVLPVKGNACEGGERRSARQGARNAGRATGDREPAQRRASKMR